MYWKLWTAVLLLAWISAPNKVQAARRKNLEVLQFWEPQSQKIAISSRQNDYPSYVYNTFPSGGYNRRRQLNRGKAAATTTTQRPFIRVWNNFVRSVQPNFGFRNLTNPLTNLFNNGNANIIETVPLQAQLYNEDMEDEEDQVAMTPTQNPNKRKRKRRKQQKRRQQPTYESVEQEDPYGYYSSPVPLRQHQSMHYYNPSVDSYYDMRRLQALNDYYDQYYQDLLSEEQPQYTEEENIGKKYTVLRPLGLAIKVTNNDSPATTESDVENDESLADNEDANNDAANENANNPEVVDDSTSMQADSSPTLSESMRNAIGSYMRDDQRNRQRQRQSERQVESISSAKIKPRNRHGFLFAARLGNA